MSLDPPISQRDIDEDTVFLTRGGKDARVVAKAGELIYPWRTGRKGWKNLVNDYGFTWVGECNAGDLIARKPKEKPMSQISLEDNRRDHIKPVPFDELPQYCVFVAEGTEDHIRIKTVFSDSVLSICPDGTVCTTVVPGGGDWSRCIPRPDLRVRIILEDA